MKVNGVVEAYNEFEAVEQIKKTCSVVTHIQELPQRKDRDAITFETRKMKEKTLAMVCSQFSIILAAGMPIVRAVSLIAEQAEDAQMKKLLRQVAQDVAAGYGLAQSFEMHGKQLPTTFIETVRAGEESGTLEHSFKKLQQYYEKNYKLKSKVSSAMIYPAFTVFVAVVVVVVIMVVAVPVFTRVFASMGVDLPGATRLLIAISNFFTNWWAAVAIAIAALVLGLKLFGRTEKGRLTLGRHALRRPLFGKLTRMKASSQFASTMSTLLSAGLSMIRALTITAKVMDNYYIGSRLHAAVSGIEAGKRLGDCIRREGQFPDLLVEMTAVGEETGALESTLEVIGEFYDNEVQTTSQKILSLLEPIIILVLACIVVFILLSVYLPIFSMYGGIG